MAFTSISQLLERSEPRVNYGVVLDEADPRPEVTMTCRLSLVAAVLVACFAAAPGYAHTIGGVVLDDSTSEQIASAERAQ